MNNNTPYELYYFRFLDFLVNMYKNKEQDFIFGLKTSDLKHFYNLVNKTQLKKINFDKKNQYLFYKDKTWTFYLSSYKQFRINEIINSSKEKYDNLDSNDINKMAKEIYFEHLTKNLINYM